jgi:hypothetical protein
LSVERSQKEERGFENLSNYLPFKGDQDMEQKSNQDRKRSKLKGITL